MTRRQIYAIGLKLIGVYFAVLAFTTLCLVIVNLLANLMPSGMPVAFAATPLGVTIVRSLQPVAYIVASFVLIRKTDWCLSKLDVEQN